jgi:hypothetical protein
VDVIGPFLVWKIEDIGTHPGLDSQDTGSRHAQRIMVGHFDVLCGAIEHGRRITVDKLGYARPTVGSTSVTMTGLISEARTATAESPESNRAISKDGSVVGRSRGPSSGVS